jgi:hypothetical protein
MFYIGNEIKNRNFRNINKFGILKTSEMKVRYGKCIVKDQNLKYDR